MKRNEKREENKIFLLSRRSSTFYRKVSKIEMTREKWSKTLSGWKAVKNNITMI